MDSSPSRAEGIYRDRLQLFSAQAEVLIKEVQNLSQKRLYSFFLLLLLGGFYFSYGNILFICGALVALGVFGVCLGRHLRSCENLLYSQEMVDINRESLHRLERKWDHLPLRECHVSPPPYGDDLDVFGKASLFHLLGTVATKAGRDRLAQWLSEAAQKNTIQKRQQAVAELVEEFSLRQEIYLQARRTEKSDPEPFLLWAEGDTCLEKKPFLKALYLFLTAGMIFFFAMDLLGFLWGRLWLVLLIVNVGLTVIYAREVDESLNTLTQRADSFSAYEKLIEKLEGTSFQSELLVEVQQTLQGEDYGALKAFSQLKSLIQLIELRQSPLFYIPFQFLFLWDFHVLARVEKRKKKLLGRPRKWFEGVGTFEALSALAGLAFDEPLWSFPDIQEGEPLFTSEETGHPLICRKNRVDNSIAFSQSQPFGMITGSNMSGKTTFLRTMGLNAVLALAGGPVCARKMALSPFRIRTSIRIRDSLELGLSYFMAEVYKIKEVVEEAGKKEHPTPLFFLLDEILHGTNSKERKVAALGIIKHLVENKALGAVTTHDLDIARSEEISPFTTHYHFQETILQEEEHRMVFDYKLRPCIATSTNALMLIRMVGIEV